MSKDANSFGHDKALAWESRGFVYTKKRMHRFDTPSFELCNVFKGAILNQFNAAFYKIVQCFTSQHIILQ